MTVNFFLGSGVKSGWRYFNFVSTVEPQFDKPLLNKVLSRMNKTSVSARLKLQ